MKNKLVFQLGTNNWQRQGEFAPGSGILHEAHHNAFDAIPSTTSYSIYPSSSQSSHDPKVGILALNHEIPICESVSPVSSYRFHSMSDEEFSKYKTLLKEFTRLAISKAEQKEGTYVDLAIAHHCFINPLVLSELNAERQAEGKPAFKLMCFAHGTALKMFTHEATGKHPEYPSRFLPMIRQSGLFESDSPIDLCAAISNQQLSVFSSIFPDFDRSRLLLSPNGYDAATFKPNSELYDRRSGVLADIELPIGPLQKSPRKIVGDTGKVVIFCGKFADWKRLDSLLMAASDYEQSHNVTTLIIGSGPKEAVRHYHTLAYERLGLRNTWFLGPRSHSEISSLNAMADLAVYPSKEEPFGLVFIEAMGCGTPVIGANSGGPRDFVSDAVGALVDEGQDFDRRLAQTIKTALSEDWKATKGPVAAAFAASRFSIKRQCEQILTRTGVAMPRAAVSAG